MAVEQDKMILNRGGEPPIELSVQQSTFGQQVVDIKALAQHDIWTYDPGFLVTAACRSSITYIDPLKGQLLYAGYPIAQLAENYSYLAVCYLLMHGQLPEQKALAVFEQTIMGHSKLDEGMDALFKAFPQSMHPMAMLMSAVAALPGFNQDFPLHDQSARHDAAHQLLGQMPTLAAYCYRRSQGKDFIQPDPSRGYIDNFLAMLFGSGPEAHLLTDRVFSHALATIFTLHADHEQNASTSTVRMAGSTGTHLAASLTAGIAALWGPAHGGANEACVAMLQEIGTADHIADYVARAKDHNDSFRLMGFGHRVYKNYDPRAKVMRQICHDVLEKAGKADDPLFDLAVKLERIALEDDYFIERKLYPNVDFYSGITLRAMGIPSNLFTVLFALARTVGWLSHWLEMHDDPELRISRPRQLYVGPSERQVPKEK